LPAMRIRMWLPLAIFIGGIVAVAAAVASGEADVSLIVIFPVFTGSSGLFILGISLIILSFFASFGVLAMAPPDSQRQDLEQPLQPIQRDSRRETKYGGFVLIGPIPIAFGSDKSMTLLMLVIGFGIAVLLLIAFLVL
jgi:uncharacterized protein (TIGR00304 family)